MSEEPPHPTFWPTGPNSREKTGPTGDGTPHARMEWFWAAMDKHNDLIEELTEYRRTSSKTPTFEMAIVEAFDELVEARESPSLAATLLGWQTLYDEGQWTDKDLADAVTHLDIEAEGAPGEINRLRLEVIQYQWAHLQIQKELERLRESLGNIR